MTPNTVQASDYDLAIGTGADTIAFNDAVYYRDSFSTRYGRYYISDTVSRNRIAGRSISGSENVPVITQTITKAVAEKRRVKGFLVGSVQGNYFQPVQAVGGGFMLQFKSDNAVEVQTFLPAVRWGWKSNDFQISYKHKISFR